jgi:hypothetical protein
MDRAMTKQHLAQAEELVARGESRVADQRDRMAELERDGQDTAQAEQLLAQFEELQAMLILSRDRLRDDLHREAKRPTPPDEGREYAG